MILALASYFVILRGDTFGVGDRITLGGVRGDAVRLGFIKTTIMEMGQPPSVSGADPAVWVNSRPMGKCPGKPSQPADVSHAERAVSQPSTQVTPIFPSYSGKAA